MSDDKTEEPTDKKIEDARKKGQIPMSRDLARLCSLVAVGEIAFATESLWRESIDSLLLASFMKVGKPFKHSIMETFSSSLLLLICVFSVCFVVCTIVGVASHWGQFGVLIAPEAATPKFDKLNPVNGLKGLISGKKLFELLMTTFKACLIGFIVYRLVYAQLPSIISLSGGEPTQIYYAFVEMLRSTFHAVIVICFCIGMTDFGIQQYFHKKSLMMDMDEIKREYKESEGDPMVKGMRKALAHQWANEEPASRTRDANAVVVNPTHFAVAMFFDGDEVPVPVVLAKGKDAIAQAMIETARECGIPVIRHVWLARTLYATCKPDTTVPKSSFEAVAHVYAVVHQLFESNEVGKTVELESFGEPPASGRA